MKLNTTQKLILSHLESGELSPGSPISIRIDQTLTQDATGTLVMLELEAMGLSRTHAELSVQYVDHNLIQEDFKNPDDHLFLESACRSFGIHYSPPGNGVSHPVHMERFGMPGKTLLGSDSHTPAAGALGMLAIGAGGMEVAMAMAGEPYHLRMPEVMGVCIVGELPEWVSAKDIILEMLRRHGVDGGVGKVIEYYGEGLQQLSAMDRHVIANMGAELGATTSVFPADSVVSDFLHKQGRGSDFTMLERDNGSVYQIDEVIDLSTLVPLVAKPSSPGNVVPVSEVEGEPIYQSYIGSSANPGYRDFAMAAEIVDQRRIAPGVSFDINPTSRQTLFLLAETGALGKLIQSGARIHQAGCNGCIGMGQAPATGRNSLRTVPRNFPGRSGTPEDRVWLCSPETAAASALTGRITDPRQTQIPYPRITEPKADLRTPEQIVVPIADSKNATIERGPNIKPLPHFEPLDHEFDASVQLKTGDDVSTDEILPAGSAVLPFRSNIPEISRFAFRRIDEDYYDRVTRDDRKPHIIVGGRNYGQGSSREHAAVAPRYLGLSIVLAKSFARIHRANLINVGILPLLFEDAAAYDRIEIVDTLHVSIDPDSREVDLSLKSAGKSDSIQATHDLNDREWDIALSGGLANWVREKQAVAV